MTLFQADVDADDDNLREDGEAPTGWPTTVEEWHERFWAYVRAMERMDSRSFDGLL